MTKYLSILFIGFLLTNKALAFDTLAKYAVLIDYDSKRVLFEKNSDQTMPPSSMAKMLTAYIAFEALKAGEVTPEDQFLISEKAWKMGGSRMFIPLNEKISFLDLLKGLIIQSGNDAAVSIAEILSGSEKEFAKRMNETAVRIGMANSNFTNATGWPDPENYSCAKDLATLAYRTIQDFSEYYYLYGETELTYNNIKQSNRNGLLFRGIGADGLKTGRTDAGGYGLTASVKRGDRRLIAVVNGLSSNKERTVESEALINYGLMNFINLKLTEEKQVIEKAKVIGGTKREVGLVTDHNILITLNKNDAKNIKTTVKYKSPLVAPFNTSEQVGELKIEIPGQYIIATYPLYPEQALPRASFLQRVQYNFQSIFD